MVVVVDGVLGVCDGVAYDVDLFGDLCCRDGEFEEDGDAGGQSVEHGLPVDDTVLKHGGGELAFVL